MLTNSFFPIFAIVSFITVVLFVEALYLMWNTYKGPDAKKVEQRLRALSAASDSSETTAVLKDRMLSKIRFVERLLLLVPRIYQLDRFLLQSGVSWTVSTLLSRSLLAGLMIYVATTIAPLPPALALGVSLIAAVSPFGFVHWKRRKRLHQIEQQLPETLDLMGRALRAGHALPSSLKMAGDEMADPIATEFRITHEEINFGISLQQALTNLSERVPIADLRYFVVAVLIQRETGGNLTEVFGNLSKVIRDRLRFHARVKVLSTEGRMSAWVLGLLPFGLAALLNFANHEFISVLWTDPIGIKIANVMLAMVAVGAIWLYKLLQIRV